MRNSRRLSETTPQRAVVSAHMATVPRSQPRNSSRATVTMALRRLPNRLPRAQPQGVDRCAGGGGSGGAMTRVPAPISALLELHAPVDRAHDGGADEAQDEVRGHHQP